MASTIYSLTLNLPELVPVRHGHPRPPEGPRPRRGAAASQIRPQSTGTRSGDLRPSEAYALPIQGYHLDLSTRACGAVLRSCCSQLHRLSYGTVSQSKQSWHVSRVAACNGAATRSGRPRHTDTPRTMGGYRARSGIAPQTPRRTDGGEAESHTHRSSTDTLHVSARSMWPALSPRSYRLFNGGVRPRAAPSRSRRETSEPHAMRACAMAPLAPCLRQID